jgi:hypothetical protein
MITERKIVKSAIVNGVCKYSIVREKYYGFRCNSLSTAWEVIEHCGVYGNPSMEKVMSRHFRLVDAKEKIENLTAN